MNRPPLWAVMLTAVSIVACGQSHTPSATATEAATETAHVDSNNNVVKLTPEQIKSADISVAQAGPADIRESLSLFGVITPNAERVRDVAARFPGVIRSVNKRVGDAVKQGEDLATVESNESLQTYPIIAPLTGVVITRHANPGEQTQDKVLFTVADLSTAWVELSLFPRDIAKVRVGQTVRIKLADTDTDTDTHPNVSAEGKIVYVAPFGSSTNQTVSARVLLQNADRKWAPGLYVTANITLSSSKVPLAVSTRALQTLDDRTVVFVQQQDIFEPMSVELGRSDGEFVEVRRGLSPGATYVKRNSFILKAELGKGGADHGH